MATPIIYLLQWTSGHFYVGQTIKPRKRRWNHLSRLRNNKHCNTHMQHVFNKYGDPEFHIIEECDVEELDAREQFYLDLLFNDSMCLNLVSDAVSPTRGVPISVETKEKISKANKGRKHTDTTRAHMSAARKGTKRGTYSDSHKQNISMAKLGKKQPNIAKALGHPVLQFSKDGILINTWASIQEAARALNLHAGHISSACNGALKTSGGFVWQKKELTNDK